MAAFFPFPRVLVAGNPVTPFCSASHVWNQPGWEFARLLLSGPEARISLGPEVFTELEHLDPAIVRVTYIEAVSPIHTQTGGRIKLSNFHAISAKRT